MRPASAFILLTVPFMLLPGASWSAPENTRPFDGNWLTTISCPNAAGALGYSYQFPAQVKDGVLHGERYSAGQPGWLMLDGRIQPDGNSNIYAKRDRQRAGIRAGANPKGNRLWLSHNRTL